MLADPASTAAEAFRMLKTNLEFALLDRDVKTLMVTSSVEREGKSTTIANLAVALARAGKRVVLVDLDLRRPHLHKFFGVEGPGLTEVALGRVHVTEALAPVAVGGQSTGRKRFGRSRGGGETALDGSAVQTAGRLEVLAAGPIPPDPGEFVGRRAVREILAELTERADIVLVDAPPVLHVGDAMTLTAVVDAVLVVTRMNVVRRNMLSELGRALARTPVPVVGFVTTAAQEEEGYGYGAEYGYLSPYAPLPQTPELGVK
jgi:non-specific protein-tyrosine kinase